MTEDHEAARKNRAAELRKRIDSLKHGEAGAETDAAASEKPASGGGAVSPRDFINEKMRELDQ
jgi:hypothetical protein